MRYSHQYACEYISYIYCIIDRGNWQLRNAGGQKAGTVFRGGIEQRKKRLSPRTRTRIGIASVENEIGG